MSLNSIIHDKLFPTAMNCFIMRLKTANFLVEKFLVTFATYASFASLIIYEIVLKSELGIAKIKLRKHFKQFDFMKGIIP